MAHTEWVRKRVIKGGHRVRASRLWIQEEGIFGGLGNYLILLIRA